ncbi:hypothetical protein PQG46_01950 [Aquirufa nivalisilvae]
MLVVSKPKERPYSEKTDTEKSNFDIFTKLRTDFGDTQTDPDVLKKNFHRTFKKIILASRTFAKPHKPTNNPSFAKEPISKRSKKRIKN